MAVIQYESDINVRGKVSVQGGLTSQFLKANGDIDSNSYALASTVHNSVTLGTANGLSLSTQVLSLGLASSGVTGALSGTDWNTFNNKQNALINPVTGTGVAGQISFWNGTSVQSGDTQLFWDNTAKAFGIGTNTVSYSKQTLKGTLANDSSSESLLFYLPCAVQTGVFGSKQGLFVSQVNTGGLNGKYTIGVGDSGSRTFDLGISVNGAERILVKRAGRVLFGTTTDNLTDLVQANGSVSSTNFNTKAVGYGLPFTGSTNIDLGSHNDFENSVILLHEIYDGTLIARNFVNGEVLVHRGGTGSALAIGVFKVNTSTAYNSTWVNLNSISGALNSTQLWTCVYGGKKYVCLRFTEAPARGFSFSGTYRNGSGGEILKLVKYRNTQTSTVLDAEIDSSLALYTTPASNYFYGHVILTNSDAKVLGGDSAGRLIVGNISQTSYIEFDGATNVNPNGLNLVTSTGDIDLYTNSLLRVSVLNNGNVSIGTTTPIGKLNVVTGNTSSFDFVAQPTGSISFCNLGETETPSIVSKSSTAAGGLFVSSLVSDGNTGGYDMRLDVRKTDGTDFTTLTKVGFRLSRTNTTLIDVLRNGNTTVFGTISATNLSGTNTGDNAPNSLYSGLVNYVHPTGDGNLHVPATGTTNSGKVLTAGATAGSLSWTTVAGGAQATSTVLGTVKLFSDTAQATAANTVSATASRTYGVQLNASGQAVVNVPWTDTLQAHTLDSHSNVTISANTAGEILKWSGTAWINNTLDEAGIAGLVSPAFTGTPTAPTAAAGSNTNQLATTAFVLANSLPDNGLIEYNLGDRTLWNNGKGDIDSNTSFGIQTLRLNTTGISNTAIGSETLTSNTIGGGNTSTGFRALQSNVDGMNNSAVGIETLRYSVSGSNNTAIGVISGTLFTGSGNLTAVSQGVFIGSNTFALANNSINEIVIGADATGAGSNTATLGNTSITSTILRGNVSTNGNVTATAHVTTGGTTAQFVDGTGALQNISAIGRPYKVYTALLSQIGTNAPTATVLENTLGGTVTWSRASVGVYLGTLLGVFTLNKTVVYVNKHRGSATATTSVGGTAGANADVFQVNSWDATNALADGIVSTSWVEVRVYN